MKKPSTLLYGSTVLFIALSVIASAFNYFLYPFLGRILPSDEYVNITVALSLLTQVGTFMSAILAINIGLTKQSKPETNTQSQITSALNSSISFLFLCLAGAFLIFSPLLMPLTHTPTYYVGPLALMMLVSIPIAIVSGYLNGVQRMAQLGIVTVLSAGMQFTAALVAATITNNGLFTLVGMAVSQVTAVILIYYFLKKESLPSLRTLIPSRKVSRRIKPILVYTIVSSFGIMALNLLQVLDLVLVRTRFPGEAHFYANIYIISRILFFAGTIFIWPFLGKITFHPSSSNNRLLAQLLLIFIILSLALCMGVVVFGEWIFLIIFGNHYSLDSLAYPALLSIGYKLFLLIITGISLYFIVVRKWTVVFLLAITSILMGVSSIMSHDQTLTLTLLWLTISAAGASCIALIAYYMYNRNPNRPT